MRCILIGKLNKPLGVLIFMCFLVSTRSALSQQPSVFRIQNVILNRGERIVGLEIDVSSGATTGISRLPAGWTTTVDNDASWQTAIRASSEVGAAALSVEQLNQILFTITKNEINGHKFGITGFIIATSDWINERRIPLTMDNIKPAN